jgi:hypothetical protein
VDPALLLAGVLFLIWPIHFRWTMGRIRRRLVERGDDPARFEQAMDRRFIRLGLVISPIGGVILIVLGLVTG